MLEIISCSLIISGGFFGIGSIISILMPRKQKSSDLRRCSNNLGLDRDIHLDGAFYSTKEQNSIY